MCLKEFNEDEFINYYKKHLKLPKFMEIPHDVKKNSMLFWVAYKVVKDKELERKNIIEYIKKSEESMCDNINEV